MEDPLDGFIETPPITVGGVGSTLYSVIAPIPSGRWAEYTVLSISSSDTSGQYACAVGDRGAGFANVFPYTNAQQYAKDSGDPSSFMYGTPYRISNTTTVTPNDHWHRITNSEKKVFVYIYALPGSGVMYVTLKFRIRKHEIIPGPSPSVHPDHMQNMNKLRADTAKQRLQELGIPGYAQEGTGTQKVK